MAGEIVGEALRLQPTGSDEHDLFDAILRLHHAFLASGLRPPAVIELATWEDGMRLMAHVRPRYSDRFRRGLYGSHGDAGAITEVDISGITVRWPQKRWQRPREGFVED